MSPVTNISSDLSTRSHHHQQLTTLHSKFDKVNEIYQCCTAQYYYKNDKIFKPAMFDNFVAGFSKFPPSAAWKLSDIHIAARIVLPHQAAHQYHKKDTQLSFKRIKSALYCFLDGFT